MCAHPYPTSNANSKKKMHVFQTAEAPPYEGRSNLPYMGCTTNSNAALKNDVRANKGTTGAP
jgi:hypothetical protein